MRRLIVILFILVANLGFGQQDALFSQYAYNQYAINPAYAGSRNSFSGVLLHRSQWVGIKDAPRIESFTVHSPLNNSSMAYGVNFASEGIGPFTNNTAGLSLAYHIKLRNSKLSFGLRGGLFQAIFDKNLLSFKEEDDVFNVGGKESTMISNFDFGTYYYTKRFFICVSITHLTNQRLIFSIYPSASNLFLTPHIYLHSGYVFDLSGKIKMKPTV